MVKWINDDDDINFLSFSELNVWSVTLCSYLLVHTRTSLIFRPKFCFSVSLYCFRSKTYVILWSADFCVFILWLDDIFWWFGNDILIFYFEATITTTATTTTLPAEESTSSETSTAPSPISKLRDCLNVLLIHGASKNLHATPPQKKISFCAFYSFF